MWFTASLSILISLTACKPETEEEWRVKFLRDIDSIQIKPYLRNPKDMQKKTFNVTLTDSVSFEEINRAISYRESPAYVCGYTGEIEIYREDSTVLSIYYNHSCNTIVLFSKSFQHPIRKRITREGRDMFKYYAQRVSDSLNGTYLPPEAFD